MGKTSRYHTVFTRRSQSHYFLITKPTILSHDSNFHLHVSACRDLRWPKNLCTESPSDRLTKFFHHTQQVTPRRVSAQRGVVL